MLDQELLRKIKEGLMITGDYHNDVLMIHINEVIEYLLAAGVCKETIYSSRMVGVIMHGVNDLWNYGNGRANLSPYFTQRVIQLVGEN